jgi:hypothetical protein
VEIIIEIQHGEDGRPTGTVRAAGSSETQAFSGNLEFLAVIERLYREDDPSAVPPNDPMKGSDNV